MLCMNIPTTFVDEELIRKHNGQLDNEHKTRLFTNPLVINLTALNWETVRVTHQFDIER